MENLADKLRREKGSSYDSIKEELLEKVTSILKMDGVLCEKIHFSSCLEHGKVSENNYPNIHNWWEISLDYKFACKEHFESFGFVVSDWYRGGGVWWGYEISL